MDLKPIFFPKTVAVIGATERARSVGRGLMENLKEFKGKVFPVNPNHKEVFSQKCFPKITDIPEEIDLAIIAVKAHLVPKIIEECLEKKVKGIIIISSGFSEIGEEGKEREKEIKKLLEKNPLPVVGPNCLGIISPYASLNASFAPFLAKKGEIAFLSQSGALIDAVLDFFQKENIGFSFIVSLGNATFLSFPEFISFFSRQKFVKVICLYIEGIKKGKDFIEICQKVSQKIPIVAIKAGRTEKGKKTILSHTASLTTSFEIFKTALKKAGVILVEDLKELFISAKVLSWQERFSKKIGILTNGGGAGVLAVDFCEKENLPLVEIPEKIKKKIQKEKIFPSYITLQNPLDIGGDALPERYEKGGEILLSLKDLGALLVILTPQIVTDPVGTAKVLIKLKKRFKKKSMVCVFMGKESMRSASHLLEEQKIPVFETPKEGVLAMKALFLRK